mmetsp:Transcript_80011/g.193968  ORF Transcript_80011/g.193968 Transcript_80011/m.193968 type:complete len:93 (-) Transcript_80011:157-435(-)
MQSCARSADAGLPFTQTGRRKPRACALFPCSAGSGLSLHPLDLPPALLVLAFLLTCLASPLFAAAAAAAPRQPASPVAAACLPEDPSRSVQK